jgi:hypothetical protein
VSPFGCQPAVVEVEPSDHGADVESPQHGIEDVGGARHAGAVRDDGAGDDGPEQVDAGGEFEGFEAAAERVEEDEAGGIDLVCVSTSALALRDLSSLTARSESILYWWIYVAMSWIGSSKAFCGPADTGADFAAMVVENALEACPGCILCVCSFVWYF